MMCIHCSILESFAVNSEDISSIQGTPHTNHPCMGHFFLIMFLWINISSIVFLNSLYKVSPSPCYKGRHISYSLRISTATKSKLLQGIKQRCSCQSKQSKGCFMRIRVSLFSTLMKFLFCLTFSHNFLFQDQREFSCACVCWCMHFN